MPAGQTANTYKFHSELWMYQGDATPSSDADGMRGTWYFITVPKRKSDEINGLYGWKKRGWGSIPVTVTIGETSWKTSIFPDRKAGAYLLPVKATVRKKEEIAHGDKVTVELRFGS